jgi:hypothetical protein
LCVQFLFNCGEAWAISLFSSCAQSCAAFGVPTPAVPEAELHFGGILVEDRPHRQERTEADGFLAPWSPCQPIVGLDEQPLSWEGAEYASLPDRDLSTARASGSCMEQPAD